MKVTNSKVLDSCFSFSLSFPPVCLDLTGSSLSAKAILDIITEIGYSKIVVPHLVIGRYGSGVTCSFAPVVEVDSRVPRWGLLSS